MLEAGNWRREEQHADQSCVMVGLDCFAVSCTHAAHMSLLSLLPAAAETHCGMRQIWRRPLPATGATHWIMQWRMAGACMIAGRLATLTLCQGQLWRPAARQRLPL